MTEKGGRIIRTGYPCICGTCGRVIPPNSHVLWDGGATCLPCTIEDRGVVPTTEEELELTAEDADREDQPVRRRRSG